jgi:Beta-propeller repeat
MKRLAILSVHFLFLTLMANSQPGSLTWAKSIGNSNNNDAGNSIAIDSRKNVFITGTFKGTVDFDPGPNVTNLTSTGSYSVYILKLDSTGNFIWAKSFGGTSTINPVTIAIDESCNVITAGKFFQTVDFDPSGSVYELASMGTGGGVFPQPVESIFIQKLDSNGNFIWAVRIGANSSGSAGSGDAKKVIVDNNRNVYLAGGVAQNGTLDFDPGPAIVNNTTGKAFLLKLDSLGLYEWVTTFGNSGGGGAEANYVNLTQSYLYVTGGSTSGVGSISHLFVRKMDLTGVLIWEKTVFGNTNVFGRSIVVDSDNNVISVGIFGGSSVDFDPGAGNFPLNSSRGDDFIQKLDANGNFVWAFNFATNSRSVAVDIDNNIYIAGSFSATVDFDPRVGITNLTTSGNAAYLQKLDAYGYLLWAGQFGNSGNQSANEIVADNLRNIYVTGYFSGSQDFDPFSPSSILQSVSGSLDAFVVKLKDSHTYITVADGNWHNGSTWLGGVVPPPEAGVVIRHIVPITADATCSSILIENSGFVTVAGGLNFSIIH